MRIHHFGTRYLLAAMGTLPLTFLACGGDAATGVVDSGTDSATKPDTGHVDGSKPTTDGGAKDTGPHPDAKASETGAETGVAETGPGDTGPGDTGPGDTGTPVDAGTDVVAIRPDAAAGCGNGTLDPGEECDDNNNLDLDGCDSSCHYEMITRMTSLSISGNAGPAFCVHGANALGTKAITSLALGQLNTPLQTDVTNGTVNVFTQFLGLSDLTGVNATGFQIGVSDGKLDPAKGTWPGTTGGTIDWAFLEDPSTVSNGLPTGLLANGAIAGNALTAGPSTVNVALNLGGSPADLTMRDAKIAGSIGTATDAPAPPPTQLKPGLVTFETITATGAAQGLCGDITVQSLAQIPVPSALTTGTTSCSEGYTYCGANMPVGPTCNSLLDVLVGGCKISILTVINATQPDVPPTGATAVTTLTPSSTGKKVTIPAAAESEAYSAFLQFAADRAHFTGEYCTASADCQTGQTCTGTDGTLTTCK